jgi:tetratricopeptide (TPR) repeat protein
MSILEEEKLLEKMSKKYMQLNSAEISDLIKKAPTKTQTLFERPYKEKMRLSMMAEELLGKGRVNQAMDLLKNVVSLGYFGNEYPYGLLGDAYMKRGDRAKALEMYLKSGSIDSMKKIKTLGLEG